MLVTISAGVLNQTWYFPNLNQPEQKHHVKMQLGCYMTSSLNLILSLEDIL